MKKMIAAIIVGNIIIAISKFGFNETVSLVDGTVIVLVIATYFQVPSDD